ncbi:MAG: DUF4340 domain-containing protein, partial [bacterium]|nr:DUF4340 domain-containing protein [bacterium]
TITSVNDLRDRSVLTFDIDSITGIEPKYLEKMIVCSKEKDQWWVTQPDYTNASSDKPNRFKADEMKIDDILWRLNSLTIKEFGEVQPKNLNNYGLDKPVLRVTLQSNTTKLPTLVLGKIDDKKRLIYAQTNYKNFVFQLDHRILQDLTITVFDLAVKKTDSKSK